MESISSMPYQAILTYFCSMLFFVQNQFDCIHCYINESSKTHFQYGSVYHNILMGALSKLLNLKFLVGSV